MAHPDHLASQRPSCPQSISQKHQTGQLNNLPELRDMSPSKDADRRATTAIREPNRKVIRGPKIKSFGLPQVLDSGSLSHSLVVRNESPWEIFKPAFSCRLAGTVIIVGRRSSSSPSRPTAIREYLTEDADKMLHRFRCIKHKNVLAARECYIDKRSIYALVEDLLLTLEHVVGCRAICLGEA